MLLPNFKAERIAYRRVYLIYHQHLVFATSIFIATNYLLTSDVPRLLAPYYRHSSVLRSLPDTSVARRSCCVMDTVCRTTVRGRAMLRPRTAGEAHATGVCV